MPKRWVTLFVILALAVTATGSGATPRRHNRPETAVQCPSDCGVRIERGPWVFDGDQPVTAVCIKAGRNLFSFTSDGSNGCYTVAGLGTRHVRVVQEREARDCQDISNVVFYHDCGGGGLPG